MSSRLLFTKRTAKVAISLRFTKSAERGAFQKETATFAIYEQNIAIAQMLGEATPIDTPKHNFRSFDEARKWAKENIVGTYRNDDTGEDIYIAKVTVEKYTSESAIQKSVSKDIHLSALKKLPDAIKTAVLKETKKDRDSNPHIVEIQRLYGAIKYEDKTYLVKITVKITRREGNRAYSYEVMEKENPGQSPGNLPEGTPWRPHTEIGCRPPPRNRIF